MESDKLAALADRIRLLVMIEDELKEQGFITHLDRHHPNPYLNVTNRHNSAYNISIEDDNFVLIGSVPYKIVRAMADPHGLEDILKRTTIKRF